MWYAHLSQCCKTELELTVSADVGPDDPGSMDRPPSGPEVRNIAVELLPEQKERVLDLMRKYGVSKKLDPGALVYDVLTAMDPEYFGDELKQQFADMYFEPPF